VSLQSQPVEIAWRREFFERVDVFIAELKRRFEQDGLNLAAKRESLLIAATSSKTDSLPSLPEDIGKNRLKLQLALLPDLFEGNSVRGSARRFLKIRSRSVFFGFCSKNRGFGFHSVFNIMS